MIIYTSTEYGKIDIYITVTQGNKELWLIDWLIDWLVEYYVILSLLRAYDYQIETL